MNVLTVNCGSSSLKYEVVVLGDPGPVIGSEPRLAAGGVERIDGRHAGAVGAMAEQLAAAGIEPGDIHAVGHRVVHGGTRTRPSPVDDGVLADIEAAAPLAPLHNRAALDAVAATSARFPRSPAVAVFDTGFHATLPPHAARYAIPTDLADRHGIRRYGFHGLAHRYLSERAAHLLGGGTAARRLVTLQLGAGCSAAAVLEGRSVDTTMGLTPLEGLVMATRSGDVDPALPAYLSRVAGMGPAEVEDLLTQRSGLLGLSGSSGDVRDLLAAERAGDERAALALDVFCHRVRKVIGAYMAVLGGADAVVFGGGIGENAPDVRARICAGMEWCGIGLDPARNDAAVGADADIGADTGAAGAGTRVLVVAVDEAAVIARDTAAALPA